MGIKDRKRRGESNRGREIDKDGFDEKHKCTSRETSERVGPKREEVEIVGEIVRERGEICEECRESG